VRHAIDTVLLTLIGWANVVVFKASRGGVVLYRFGGFSGALLTVTSPDAPIGEELMVCCLPDGDDHIVLAPASDTRLPHLLRTATAVTLSDAEIPVDCVMLTDAESAALLSRLRKRLSISERHQLTEHREIPIARLTRRPS
jgi:hypothetical protein